MINTAVDTVKSASGMIAGFTGVTALPAILPANSNFTLILQIAIGLISVVSEIFKHRAIKKLSNPKN